jgi:hypothetical protein
MGIVQSLFSRIGSDRKESDKKPAVATMPVKPAVANLMILVPDAAGIAAYQQHAFVAASGAEAYLGSIFSGDTHEGAIMFWALTWRPSDNGRRDVGAEVVILIRDTKRRGLVYTFSFVDLDTAYDFVREEMKAGLDLNRTAIFWAVPAEATADSWGKITVSPSKSPTFGPANLVAPDHQPNGTQLHSDETPPGRLPEEPAIEAIDEAGVSNISDILEAKVLRPSSHSLQPTDELEEPEDVAEPTDEPSDSGNGHANAGPETLHVNLGDVFGGRRDPETLTTLSDFRHGPEGSAANGLHAADDPINAADEAASGIVVAWSNIGAAIDKALDAQVARRVSATIAWRNAARALRQAAESESGRRAKAGAIRKGKSRRAGSPAQESKARVSTGTKTAMKATETMKKLMNGRSKAKDAPKKAMNSRSKAKDAPKKATNGRSKAKDAPKKASNGRSEAADAPKPVAEVLSAADERAAAIELWRSRESGRFTAKKDSFEGFNSPPGRF